MPSGFFDAVIVGAGPAGSTVGFLLAEAGYDVAIVDRAEFPRSKPCGESLNPGAVECLRRLEMLDEIVRLPHERIRGWRIHTADGEPLEVDFPGGAWGMATERGAFDDCLFRRARGGGATFILERVSDLVFDDGRVVGVRARDGAEIRGRIVVGADGLRSVVLRRLGLLRRGPHLRKLALTAHVRDSSIPHGSGVLAVHDLGCAGMVNVAPGVANVVLVFRDAGILKGGVSSQDVFDRVLPSLPFLATAERCSAVHATGPFDWPTRGVSAPGAILVGDAAGYYDPFTGQGLCHALRSGMEAAEAVSGAIDDPACEATCFRAYERWHAAASRSATALQKLIEIGVARPRLFAAAIGVLRRTPSVAGELLAAVGDLRSAGRSPA